MGDLLRVVLDTNVLIGAIIKPKSRVGLLVQYLYQAKYTLIYSSDTLDEFVEVSYRPKMRQKYHLDDEMITMILGLILVRGENYVPTEAVTVCRDPDDNILLSLALDSKADFIVSGDEDLLSLSPFHGIPVLKPADFLEKLKMS